MVLVAVAVARFVPDPAIKSIIAERTFLGARALERRIFDLAVIRSPRAGGERELSGNSDGPPLYKSHFHTGELYGGSIGWILRIGAIKKYALVVHNGSSPHTIPGNPILRFFWPGAPMGMGGPGVYYFKSVHHPGAPPRPWLWQSTAAILTANSFQSLGGIIA